MQFSPALRTTAVFAAAQLSFFCTPQTAKITASVLFGSHAAAWQLCFVLVMQRCYSVNCSAVHYATTMYPSKQVLHG